MIPGSEASQPLGNYGQVHLVESTSQRISFSQHEISAKDLAGDNSVNTGTRSICENAGKKAFQGMIIPKRKTIYIFKQ